MNRFSFLRFLLRTRGFITEALRLITKNSEAIDEIMVNHLPHIQEDITGVKSAVGELHESVGEIHGKLDKIAKAVLPKE